MQEVEDGVLLARSLVAGWGIDGEATVGAEGLAVIPHLANGAMGHVVDVVVVAFVILLLAYDELVGDSGHVAVDIDVGGVDGANTIFGECIGVVSGRNRSGGGVFPNAVLAFLHIYWGIDGPNATILSRDDLLRQEFASQLHGLGLGSTIAEGDGEVGVDFRRNDLSATPQCLLCFGCHRRDEQGRKDKQ